MTPGRRPLYRGGGPNENLEIDFFPFPFIPIAEEDTPKEIFIILIPPSLKRIILFCALRKRQNPIFHRRNGVFGFLKSMGAPHFEGMKIEGYEMTSSWIREHIGNVLK
jgi:hypothetical protein